MNKTSEVFQPEIVISKSAFNMVLHTFSYEKYEKGGLLTIKDNRVIDYFLDLECHSRLSYHPSICISEKIKEIKHSGYSFAFIHSHPKGKDTSELSLGDMDFAKEFLELNPQFDHIDMALSLTNVLKYYRFFRKNPNRHEECRVFVDKEQKSI